MSASPSRLPAVFSESFRFFFLAAGLFAMLSMGAWLTWLYIHWLGGAVPNPTIAVAPHLWHAHEMIFGYSAAVIAGFFLTAVPNWTGSPPARPSFIMIAGGFWIAGRAVVWYAAHLPPVLVAVVDLLFLLTLVARIASDLRRNPKPANLVLLGLLFWLFASNATIHAEWIGFTADTTQTGLRMGLFGLAAMISIVGGRIVPAFTRNALMREGKTEILPVTRPLVDRIGIAMSVLMAVTAAFDMPPIATGVLAVAAALANGTRLSGWGWRQVLHSPILWSLHLGYGLLVLGYLTVGLAALTGFPGETSALHLLGIGGVGAMTLAVMTRAALGHAGRELKVSTSIAIAYTAIAFAALIRGFGTWFAPEQYYLVMFASGGLWVFGFLMFVIDYWWLFVAPKNTVTT